MAMAENKARPPPPHSPAPVSIPSVALALAIHGSSSFCTDSSCSTAFCHEASALE